MILKALLESVQAETDKILAEAEKHKDDFPEPINWADLSCIEAVLTTDADRENAIQVTISEAAPDCLELQRFVEEELFFRGFKEHPIAVKTEW
jgi:hypothetical protein